jgi:hypothetical protein
MTEKQKKVKRKLISPKKSCFPGILFLPAEAFFAG